jgi:hypothetical protein
MQLQSVCHDTLPWLISVSLDEKKPVVKVFALRVLLLALAIYCGGIAGSLLNKAFTGRWRMFYPNIFDPRRVFAFFAIATFAPDIWLHLTLGAAVITSIVCLALSRPPWRWVAAFVLFIALSFSVSYVMGIEPPAA